MLSSKNAHGITLAAALFKLIILFKKWSALPSVLYLTSEKQSIINPDTCLTLCQPDQQNIKD